VIGTGHFKPSVSVMVNQLYKEGDPRQQGAFGIFYMGINLGALLGTFSVGYVGERIGWHWGFTLAAIGMIVGLLAYTVLRKKLLDGVGLPNAGDGSAAKYFIPVGVLLAACVGYMFYHDKLKQIDEFFSDGLVWKSLLGLGVAWAIFFTFTRKQGDRGPTASIFIFMLFNFLFWLAFEQAATSINFFTDEKVNRTIGGAELTTSFFQNINPFTIIILSPVFGIMWAAAARRKLPFPQPVKIGLGLILLGLGFGFMVIAGKQVAAPGVKAAMWTLFATYFLHTVGELFLSPTGLSYVAKAAPAEDKSLLMGVWFLSSFLAYTVGGKIAGEADPLKIADAKFFFQHWGIDMGGGYANFFFLFVFLSVGGGILIILLTPLLRKLMRDPND
jgi:POT family proton-dependent oligopeptide transporter